MLLHYIMILSLSTYPFTIALGTLQKTSTSVINNIAKPNCPTHCGNVTVPYPFGIGKDTGCSLDSSFYVTRNMSSGTQKLFLHSSNKEIYNISDSELRICTWPAFRCYNQEGTIRKDYYSETRLGAFTLSQKNRFTVLGCDDYYFITETSSADFSSGCLGLCHKAHDVLDNGQCSAGMGCCRTRIPKGLNYYNLTFNTFLNHTNVWSFNPCSIAFAGEHGSFVFHGTSDLSNVRNVMERIWSTVPVVVDWMIGPERGCSECKECKENSSCYDVDGGGYRCRCNNGYEGNAYLDPGCHDINECEDPGTYPCHGDCMNTPGSYNCTCPAGSFGDAKIEICQHPNNLKFIIAMVIGLLATLSCILGTFYGIRRRKLVKLREKFFEQNGGVLLKQKIKSQGSHEAMALFSFTQLQKATNSYSQENIIGRGAYGVVYKGVLPDNRVVAIKKSKIVDGSQAEQL